MLGVIGGSGFYQLNGLNVDQEIASQTRYGAASDAIVVTAASCDANRIAFLPRHGRGHHIAPHKINYRANIAALKAVGVSHILAINAVGSCYHDFAVGDYVLVNQCIDYSYGREHTFHDEAFDMHKHIDFTSPIDADLFDRLLVLATAQGLTIHSGGVYACTQGPRFETAAEVRRIQRDGGEVIGMTMMPEAALARELSIPYVSIAVVVNAAAGLTHGAVFDQNVIANVFKQCVTDLSPLIKRLSLDLSAA